MTTSGGIRRVATAAVLAVVVVAALPTRAVARPLAGPVTGADATPRTVAPRARAFRWPVVAAPVVVFDPPATPWGRGHRGVDLVAAAGTRVAAMGHGVVGFAGVVAGRAWVSVDHPGELRTTVGPMATMAVAAGEQVVGGQVLGTAAGTAHASATAPTTGRLHVSARRAGSYVDPAGLVGAWVPTLVGPGASRRG